MQLIHERDSELDWQAFCYVAGEMADDERASFEACLADDQAAREAVARAVELVQATALAESCEAVAAPAPRSPAKFTRRTSWPRRLAWMGIGASAALVLAAVALNWDAISARFAPPSVDRGELAAVWSQTRDEIRQIVQAEPVEFPPVMETEFVSDESLPSWITAAVFSEPAGAESDLDGPSTHDES